MAAPPLPLPGAEPAMDGALVAHQPQHAIWIPVNQVWNGRKALFARGVLKTGGIRNLFCIRDYLFPDGVPGASDKPLEIGIQPEGVLADNRSQGSGVEFPFSGETVERKHEISERRIAKGAKLNTGRLAGKWIFRIVAFAAISDTLPQMSSEILREQAQTEF